MKKILITVLFLPILLSAQDFSLKEFSYSYNPRITDGDLFPAIYEDSINWENVIFQSAQKDSLKTVQYVSLILLKLYKAHVLCCDQAYTLNPKNPIIYYFLSYNGFYENEYVQNLPKGLVNDLIWSNIAYRWLNNEFKYLARNQKLVLKNKFVKSEFFEIKNIVK